MVNREVAMKQRSLDRDQELEYGAWGRGSSSIVLGLP